MTKPLTPEELDELEEAWNTCTLVTSKHVHKVPRLIATVRQLQEERAQIPEGWDLRGDERYITGYLKGEEAGRAAEREEILDLVNSYQKSYCEYDEALGHHAVGKVAEAIRSRK